MLRPIMFMLLAIGSATAAATAEQKFKRPMYVNRLVQLGLEVRTEVAPRWDTRLQSHENGRPVFVAETPASTYPPAGMTWTVSNQVFSADEFSEAARGALAKAAANYGLPRNEIQRLPRRAATYGDLEGYEAQFTAAPDGVPIDVKVFFGHSPGKPAVAMQVFTLRGKLPHISEQIRRSWTNTRYLKQGVSQP